MANVVLNSANVGYHSIETSSAPSFLVDEIEGSGNIAIAVPVLSAEALAGIDLLYLVNPSNYNFSPAYLAALPAITTAVENGLHLVMFDRQVSQAATALPGAQGITFVRRDGSDDADIDLAPNAPGTFFETTDPDLNDTDLDGGRSSSHGYADVATLPDDAVNLLTRPDDSQSVAFAYNFGAGSVFYSTIPVDYYSLDDRASITTEEIQRLVTNTFAFMLGDNIVRGMLVEGTDGADTLNGDNGPDTITGGDGDDLILGFGSLDLLDGGAGADTINAGTGNDLLQGGAGVDSLLGGPGRDILDGGAAADVMRGGAGDDLYIVDNPADSLF